MKKIMILAVTGLISACAIVPSQTGMTLVGETREAITATSASGNRRATACAKNFLGLFSQGDSSIEAAKRKGGITVVSSVDQEVKRYLVFAEICTIVRGK